MPISEPFVSRAFAGLPPSSAGQRIGLYGGSFNPAHDGHRHVSLIALGRLQLDVVWWLVTPGNPLKDTHALPPLAERMAAAARIARHPRLVITGVEAELATCYSADLVGQLTMRLADRRFVWIMGADNLATFHHWRHWREMTCLVPIAVVDRPGWRLKALASPAAHWMASRRLVEEAASLLPNRKPPAWVILSTRLSERSSTALRARLGP